MLMKPGKITKNLSGQGSISGRLTIPVDFLEGLDIKFFENGVHDNNVLLSVKDNKLIIEKISLEEATELKAKSKTFFKDK